MSFFHEDARQMCELALLQLSPEQLLPKYVSNPQDVYSYRSVIKEIRWNEFALNYLCDILITALQHQERFRTLECLRVVRCVIRRKPMNLDLSSATVTRLAFLYQTFIFSRNDAVKWCVSSFLRSQPLDDATILWLINNWERSEHIVNRLLRYPAYDKNIYDWALKRYTRGELSNRRSELIGLLINDRCIPQIAGVENSTIMVWAIYYSRLSDEYKQDLLLERISNENLDAFLKVCVRLGYPDVIATALANLR